MEPAETANQIIRIAFSVLGVLANFLTFFIFTRQVFKKNSIGTYCQALAVLSLLTNLFQLSIDVSNLFFTLYYPATFDLACKFFYWLTVSLSSIIPWVLVAFSFDMSINMRRKPIELLKKK